MSSACIRKCIDDDHCQHDDQILCKYIAGVMVRMRMSRLDAGALAILLQRTDGWDDFTPIQLKKVVAALNLHSRRRR